MEFFHFKKQAENAVSTIAGFDQTIFVLSFNTGSSMVLGEAAGK